MTRSKWIHATARATGRRLAADAGRPGIQSCVRGLVAATLLGVAVAGAAPINGGVEAPVPDVFYNFYAPAVPAGSYPGSGAQLYVSPRPVPPRVGHTWYTYPPFMPHEFLYKHRRHYIRPAGATGMRTDVHAYWW